MNTSTSSSTSKMRKLHGSLLLLPARVRAARRDGDRSEAGPPQPDEGDSGGEAKDGCKGLGSSGEVAGDGLAPDRLRPTPGNKGSERARETPDVLSDGSDDV